VRELGDLALARELLELAIATGIDHVGPEHPSVVSAQQTLSAVLQQLGE
jgi:hypothetical protein